MEKKKFRFFLMIFCGLAGLFFFPFDGYGENDLFSVLEGVKTKYNCVHGLKISYRREVITKTMAMLGTQAGGDLASGKIFFKPPNLVRLEQSSPRIETLVTNGKSLWWYIPEEKKVYVYSSEQFGNELKALNTIWTGFTDKAKSFKITLLGKDQKGNYLLELVPDPPWEQVDRIKVKVSETFEIQSIDIINTLGTTTRFYFDKIISTGDLEDHFFEFTVPEGVKVIHEMEN